MNTRLTFWILLLCLGAAACAEEAPETEVVTVKFKEADAFYDLLNLTAGNYIPLSDDELLAESVFVGTGTVVGVKEGMEVVSLNADPPRSIYTLVIELSIDSEVKGSSDEGSVYVEHLHGGAFSVETYAANKPTGKAMVFLSLPSWRASDDVDYVGVGRNVPKGATLYTPTTPQGWLIEDAKGVRQQLLSPNEGSSVFGSFKTLADLERNLAEDKQGDEQPDGGTDSDPGTPSQPDP